MTINSETIGSADPIKAFKNLNLICQHCGERIVARAFGKCPGCHRELPEELKLTEREKEIDALDEVHKKKMEALGRNDIPWEVSEGGNFDFPDVSDFP